MKNKPVRTPWSHKRAIIRQHNSSHSFYEGILGKELQLFLASFWFVVYYYCITFGESLFTDVLGWFALTFGTLSLLLFLVIHALPWLWKKFISLIEI